jgi:hypothetical protein
MALKIIRISKMSSTAKAICAISTIILIVAIGFIFNWLWFWFCWEIVGTVLVSIGCVGEWLLLYKRHDAEHTRREKYFAIAVAVGVTMDVFGLLHAIPGALRLSHDVAEANGRASSNELQVAILRQEHDRFEMDKRSPSVRFDRRQFTESLKIGQKIDVQLVFEQNDSDAFEFAETISECLHAAGWSVTAFRPMSEADSNPKTEQLPIAPLHRRVAPLTDGLALEVPTWPRPGFDLSTNTSFGTLWRSLVNASHSPFDSNLVSSLSVYPCANLTVPDNTVRLVMPTKR